MRMLKCYAHMCTQIYYLLSFFVNLLILTAIKMLLPLSKCELFHYKQIRHNKALESSLAYCGKTRIVNFTYILTYI